MWFYLALTAAVFSATSVIVNKRVLRKVSPLVLMFFLVTIPIPLSASLLIGSPLPQISQWYWVGITISSLLFAIGKLLTLVVIQKNFLSQIIPLNVIAVVFAYILGLLFLKETISWLRILGIIICIIGLYFLQIKQPLRTVLEPFKVLFHNKNTLLYLLAILLMSIASLFDKIALQHTTPKSSALVLLGEDILTSMVLGTYLLIKKPVLITEIKKQASPLLLSGLVYGVSVLFFFSGLIQGPLALVIIIEKLSILLVSLLSILFFKEKLTLHTAIATVLLVCGALIIKLG